MQKGVQLFVTFKSRSPIRMSVSFQAAPVMKAARSNMLGVGIPNNKVKYSRLAADDDGYIDLQVS